MPFSLRLTVLACALSLTLACSNQAATPSGSSTPAGTPTVAPTPTSTPLPASTRKGVSDGADNIINAVVAHDVISLEKLTKLSSVPCSPTGAATATATSSAPSTGTGTATVTATSTPRATSTASTAGSTTPPPCPAGVTGTSATDVLPVLSCESELRTKANVRGTLDSITATAPTLVAAYKVPSTYMPQTPGDTLMLFARHPTIAANLAAGLLVSGDRVVAVVFGCQASPAQVVPTGATAIYQAS